GMIAAVCAELAVLSLFNVELFRETGSMLKLFYPIPILIGVLVFIANYKFKVHPIMLIVSSAVIGIILL
ncbi:MAG: hypothetical protein J7L77_03055, partial [Clostridiales bacterium]|nr:hypothetical protein [Clostridiales bacterium]